MKKYNLSLCLLTAFSLLVLPLVTSATSADFITDSDMTVQINVENSGAYANFTILSGAKAEAMTVNASNISLTITSGDTVTITSADRKAFIVTGFDNEYTFTCGDSLSTLVIAASTSNSSHTGAIEPRMVTCSVATGSGGGGSSAPPAVVTPSNPSISIDAGEVQTRNREITLTLGATNASMMMLSENSDFVSAVWENYTSSKAFTLSEGVGDKTVYVKFKSSTGGISSVVNDSISLLEALTASVSQSVSSGVGGTVSLADNSASVLFPGGALANDADVTIEPTESFVAPSVGEAVVGDQAFEFVAKVGGVEVAEFESDVTLTFGYTDDQIVGLKESTLKVYYWSATLNDWVLAGGAVNLLGNSISVDIDHFTLFVIIGDKEFGSGNLVKLACDGSNASICSAVYYLGNDGKRYVFPHEKIFLSWYDDFSSVKEVSATDLASYIIGGNVTYRPGVRMIKITSDPKVYVVGKDGLLRWIQSESVASALYGANWNQFIDDLADAFFFSYTIGSDVSVAADFDKDAIKAVSSSINVDKGL